MRFVKGVVGTVVGAFVLLGCLIMLLAVAVAYAVKGDAGADSVAMWYGKKVSRIADWVDSIGETRCT